jgi:hypothetical protein
MRPVFYSGSGMCRSDRTHPVLGPDTSRIWPRLVLWRHDDRTLTWRSDDAVEILFPRQVWMTWHDGGQLGTIGRRARQDTCDRTRSVFKFAIWCFTGVDRTPAGGALGRLVVRLISVVKAVALR